MHHGPYHTPNPPGRFRALAAVLLVGWLPLAGTAEAFDPKIYAAFEDLPVTRITLAEGRITRDFVILRELETRVGEPLRVETLQEDWIRLEDLHIFSRVDFDLTREGEGVGIDLTVNEMPWIIPFIALGYNDEDGWSIGPAVASVNFLGRAISLSGSAKFGGATTFDVTAAYPWITGNHLGADIVLAKLDRDDTLNGFKEKSLEISPWVRTYLGRNGRLAGTFSYFRMDSDTDGKTLSPDNRDHLYRMGTSLGYDTRDALRRPGRGWLTEYQVLRTGGPLGGDGDSWLNIVDVRRFIRTRKHDVIAVGGLLSMQSGEVGRDIPGYLQYRMGGANSIRGYNIDELGREIFGKNQFIVTVEYRVLLRPVSEFRILKWSFGIGWELAAFADGGTAWNEGRDFNVDRWRSGAGVGFHVLVPGLERFRLELAMGRGGQIEFHIGAGSKMSAQRFRLR